MLEDGDEDDGGAAEHLVDGDLDVEETKHTEGGSGEVKEGGDDEEEVHPDGDGGHLGERRERAEF